MDYKQLFLSIPNFVQKFWLIMPLIPELCQ